MHRKEARALVPFRPLPSFPQAVVQRPRVSLLARRTIEHLEPINRSGQYT